MLSVGKVVVFFIRFVAIFGKNMALLVFSGRTSKIKDFFAAYLKQIRKFQIFLLLLQFCSINIENQKKVDSGRILLFCSRGWDPDFSGWSDPKPVNDRIRRLPSSAPHPATSLAWPLNLIVLIQCNLHFVDIRNKFSDRLGRLIHF